MDGHEQVSPLGARDFRALTQRDEVIAGTGQFSAIALFAIDLALKLLGNREHDVLFFLTTAAGRARVFTAVTGINNDDDVALAVWHRGEFDLGLGRADRHHRGRSRRGGGRGIGDRRRRVGIGGVVVQVDHQTVAVLLVRREGEALGRHRFFQVDDHAQVVRRALRRAHAGDRRVGRRHVQRPTQGGAVDVDDQTIRGLQREDTVLNRARQVENQPRVIRGTP